MNGDRGAEGGHEGPEEHAGPGAHEAYEGADGGPAQAGNAGRVNRRTPGDGAFPPEERRARGAGGAGEAAGASFPLARDARDRRQPPDPDEGPYAATPYADGRPAPAPRPSRTDAPEAAKPRPAPSAGRETHRVFGLGPYRLPRPTPPGRRDRTEWGRAAAPGRPPRQPPTAPPTLYGGHEPDPGPTASALADDAPAPSPRVQLSALQALCRQVFGVRLALIALGTPFALQNAADGAARYLVLAAAVTGFMASYAMLRDWERFGPAVLRHPALLGLDLFIGAVLLLTASPASPLGYAAACTPLLAGLLYGWRGSGVLTGCQLVVLLIAHRAWGDALTSGASTLLVAGFCVAAGITGVTLRNLMFRFGAATTALAEANARLAVAGAVEAERARLARDLHDSLAKTLHGLALTADALAEGTGHLPPDTLRDRAVQVAAAARRAAADSRDLLAGLRHDAADPTDPVDLAETLRAGLPPGTPLSTAGPLPPVPHAVAGHLLAIAAEAVENAHRHAAGPTRVSLAATSRSLRLTVTDGGPGLPAGLTLRSAAETGHFGLVGMAERATAIGGRLRVGPADDPATHHPGTEVRLELPLAGLDAAPPPPRRPPTPPAPGTPPSARREHLSDQNPPTKTPD
ncbi:histidine kinase [Streptomyces diastaticus]|uniref:histidine kinase n=1 Tax=Streptomyces diastaticus TaxID=1956 RepID=UPI0035DEC37D